MNYAENPITDLADCVAHAQYVGFSDIEYETRDWDWYTVDQDQAVREIMRNSGGTLDPVWVKNKISDLYESVGVK